jgi:polyferredoxin
LSSAQKTYLILIIIALFLMFAILFGLSWGFPFQMVIIGGIACFIFAIIMTIILLLSLLFSSNQHNH